MKFEVVNQLGSTVMSTEFEKCIYDDDTLSHMANAGFKFKVDGKFTKLGTVKQIRSNGYDLRAVPSTDDNLENDTQPCLENDLPQEELSEQHTNKDEHLQPINTEPKQYPPISLTNFDDKAGVELNSDNQTEQEHNSVDLSQYIGWIQCIETEELFKKQSEAARKYEIDPASVSDSIKTGRKRAGYTFRKITEDDVNV